MKSKINKLTYLLSGLLTVFISLMLLFWGYSNKVFPEYSDVQIISGEVSNVEIQGWKIKFNLEGYNDQFLYYRHYGNFELVKELLEGVKPEIELTVDKNGTLADSKIYEISINGKKITDFGKNKSNHGDYIKSIYMLSITLFLLGSFGLFLGMSKKSFLVQSN